MRKTQALGKCGVALGGLDGGIGIGLVEDGGVRGVVLGAEFHVVRGIEIAGLDDRTPAPGIRRIR